MIYKAPYSQTSIEIQKTFNKTLLSASSVYYSNFFVQYATPTRNYTYYDL